MTQPSLNFDAALDAMQQYAHGPKWNRIFSGTPVTGEELRDRGMEQVVRNKAAKEYAVKMNEALNQFPVGSRLTIEDLTAIAGRPPEGAHHNVCGQIVRTMALRGLIRKTGRTIKPTRAISRARDLAEWEKIQ